MSTYTIGDVQGCYQSLLDLLGYINFERQKDTLWFVGDLINRGSNSLEVLRFVKGLGDKAITVLGNHELHLLAVAAGVRQLNPSDTIQTILEAQDAEELLTWLRQLPLLHYDEKLDFVMVHAGLIPQWDLTQAQAHASEVEKVLRSSDYKTLLASMYGSEPNLWQEHLSGMDRLRLIVNVLTRIRYCDAAGVLNLKLKGPIGTETAKYMPWFSVPNRKNHDLNIVFGHWAALYENWKKITEPGIYPVDSGCIWGKSLTALRLEDKKRFSVDCEKFEDY